ncbi:hypothetical protein ACL5HQ_13875 [Stenotrophomonas maltophilia]
MSAAAPSLPVIEVPGCGMRLRVMKDPAGWSVSGWRRTKGATAMAVGIPPITPPVSPAPAPAEPTAEQETE